MFFYITFFLATLTVMSCSSAKFLSMSNQNSNTSDLEQLEQPNDPAKEPTAQSPENTETSNNNQGPADRPVMITGSWLVCEPIKDPTLKYGCSVFVVQDQKFTGVIDKWDITLKTNNNSIIKIENFAQDPDGNWQVIFDIPESLKNEFFSFEVIVTSNGTTISKTEEVKGNGAEVGGYRWYFGDPGMSCDATCASHGLTCDIIGTRDFAGSGGTNVNCQNVMDALGINYMKEPEDIMSPESKDFVHNYLVWNAEVIGCSQQTMIEMSNPIRLEPFIGFIYRVPSADTQTTCAGVKDQLMSRACSCN